MKKTYFGFRIRLHSLFYVVVFGSLPQRIIELCTHSVTQVVLKLVY